MAEPTETQDIYRTLDLSLRVGEVLLSAGAGAADVSATILSVARACGLRGAFADVTFTGLTLTHQPRFDAAPAILSRQVQYRVIDYEESPWSTTWSTTSCSGRSAATRRATGWPGSSPRVTGCPGGA